MSQTAMLCWVDAVQIAISRHAASLQLPTPQSARLTRSRAMLPPATPSSACVPSAAYTPQGSSGSSPSSSTHILLKLPM